MAKLSELTAVTPPLASGDEFAVVDKSDTTQAASGTTKRVTFAQLASELEQAAEDVSFTDTDMVYFVGETVQEANETADARIAAVLGDEDISNGIEVANAATSNADVVLGFAAADGLFTVSAVVMGTIVGGTKYRSIWRLVCERASGTVTVLANDLIYPAVEPAQMTTAFSNNSGNLRVAVTNSSGAVMNIRRVVDSKLHTYPDAPT